jgi:hypothetical protein
MVRSLQHCVAMRIRARTDPAFGEERVLLIGCVKGKQAEERPAQDLYRSPLWSARRDYALRSGSRWFILSALFAGPTTQGAAE